MCTTVDLSTWLLKGVSMAFIFWPLRPELLYIPQAEVCVDLSSLVNMPKSFIAKLLDAWMSHHCPKTVSFH